MQLPLFIHNPLRRLTIPISQIDEMIPEAGVVIDLGCGEGTLATYLARKPNRNIIGVDMDAARLPASNQENLKFIASDIRKFDTKGACAVVLSDVLHHLSFDDQDSLLKNISHGLKKDGRFIIKEIDLSENIRSRLSRFWDFVFYPKDEIFFSSHTTISQKLRGLKFSVTITRPLRILPASTTLFLCVKK